MDTKNKNKVFWVVNFIPVHLASIFDSEIEVSGGWIKGMENLISRNPSIDLVYVFKIQKDNIIKGTTKNNVSGYIGIPYKNFQRHLKTILEEENPSVIHVWGTEMLIDKETAEVATFLGMKNRLVFSVQGLVSEIKNYCTIGLPKYVINGQTVYEIFRKCSLKKIISSYEKRSTNELYCLKSAGYILGRTDWDYACIKKLGLKEKYVKANENLRSSFYDANWDYRKCTPHSIFTSRGNSSIKGVHFLLEAMPYILQEFPDANLYISGEPPFFNTGIKRYFKKTKYGQYIKKLIYENRIEEHVFFLGALNEQKMLDAYLNANVFVMPSTIENSSNSLGEAMLLGMPCVASDVGGVSSMMKHKEEGFVYQCNSPSMIAYYVCKIFEDNQLAVQLGRSAKRRAEYTHDREINSNNLISLYQEIEHNGSK